MMSNDTAVHYRHVKARNLALDEVPDELKRLNRWIPWQQEPQSDPEKKPRKRPMDYRTGYYGSYTDVSIYLPFEEARKYMEQHDWDGLMFILSPDLPYAGLDFDECIDERGRFYSQRLENTLIGIDSYAEISPSGVGVKMLVKGKVRDLHRHQTEYQPSDSDRMQSVEVYDNKPWTFTGLRLALTPGTINERSAVLNELYIKVFGERPVRKLQNDEEFPADITLTEGERAIVTNEVIQALMSIDPQPYEDWRDVGFALKTFGRQIGDEEARRIWRNWSKRTDNFCEQDLDYQWDRFSDDQDGITIGTVFYLAQDAGYEFSRSYKEFLRKKRSARDPRPRICLPYGEVELRDTAKQLGRLMGESANYFVRDSGLFALVRRDGREHLRLIDRDVFRGAVEDVAQMGVHRPPRKDEGDHPIWERKRMSVTDASAIAKAKAFIEQIPAISIVTNCPVLAERDGKLEEICGYDSVTKIYSRGEPTEEVDLTTAIAVINEVYADYDFVTANDKSRAIAGLLSPAVTFGRLLGLKRSPIDLTESDYPQSGKGLRVNLIACVYNERATTVVQRQGGVGSWDESFGNALLRGNPIILIDNVRGRISSQSLESFATEDSAPVRPVGQQEIHVDPRTYVLYITSNAARGEPDLAQRVCITSIRRRPDNYEFRQYAEGDIRDHVAANRQRYLGAVHSILKEWHRRGKPTKPVGIRSSFRKWYELMEYILVEIMGEASVFEGVMDSIRRLGNPLLPWLRELAIAMKEMGYLEQELSASELVGIVEECDLAQGWVRNAYNLSDESERERAFRSLGGKIGRLFGDKEEIKVDGFSIRRIVARDNQYRERKRYRFTELAAGTPQHDAQTPQHDVQDTPQHTPNTPRTRPATQNPIESGTPPTPETHSSSSNRESIFSDINTTEPVGGVGGVWGSGGDEVLRGDVDRQPLVFDPDWGDNDPPVEPTNEPTVLTTTTTTEDWLPPLEDADFKRELRIMGLD